MTTTQDLYSLEATLQTDASLLAVAVDMVCFSLEEGRPVTVQDLTLVAVRVSEMRTHISQIEQGVLELVGKKE